MIPSLLFILCFIQYQKLHKKDSHKEWKNVRLYSTVKKLYPLLKHYKKGLPHSLKGE